MGASSEGARATWEEGSEQLRLRFDRLWRRFQALPGPTRIAGWVVLGYWLIVLQVFRSRFAYRSVGRWAAVVIFGPWLPLLAAMVLLPWSVAEGVFVLVVWPFLAAALLVAVGGFLVGHVPVLGVDALAAGAQSDEVAAKVRRAHRRGGLLAVLTGVAGSLVALAGYAALRRFVQSVWPDTLGAGPGPVLLLDAGVGWAVAAVAGFALGSWTVLAIRRRPPPQAANA